MNLAGFTLNTNDEERKETYPREQGFLKASGECPHCPSTRINPVRRFKYTWYSCHPEWGIRRAVFSTDAHVSSFSDKIEGDEPGLPREM